MAGAERSPAGERPDAPAPEAPEPRSATLPEGPDAEALLVQAIRVALGAVTIAAEVAGAALRRTLPVPPATDEPASERTDGLALFTGAALGLGVSVTEAIARVADRMTRTISPLAAWTLAPLPVSGIGGRMTDRLTSLDGTWRKARPETEAAAAAFTRELVPEIVDAMLDQIDLTWLVAERVDIDELAGRLDIEKVLARVDIDEVASRIDLEAIVARIDLDKVAAGIDVDAVAARLDVDAFLERVDLAGLARYIVDEIDLPELIRQSTGTVTTESVRSVRMQGIEADVAVERLVGRVFGRRSLTLPPADEDAPEASPPDHQEPA